MVDFLVKNTWTCAKSILFFFCFFSLLFHFTSLFLCPILSFRSTLQLQSIQIWMMHCHLTLFIVYVLFAIVRCQQKQQKQRKKNPTEKYNDIIFIVIYLTFENYRRSVLTINLNINTALYIFVIRFKAFLLLLVFTCRR